MEPIVKDQAGKGLDSSDARVFGREAELSEVAAVLAAARHGLAALVGHDGTLQRPREAAAKRRARGPKSCTIFAGECP